MWSLLLFVIVLSFSNFVHSFSTVLYEACGSSPSMNLKGCNLRSNRITNGVAAEIGEIPWQISLAVRYLGTTSGASCGGSIISSNSILTAAHCFDAHTIGNVQYNYDIKMSSVRIYSLTTNRLY
uniref:Peptidase S1 domain-containing protein n=1 Tax=Lepeophtheirus salmonis TaxID=72036 RepID=A0A0K2VFM1_LEPSM